MIIWKKWGILGIIIPFGLGTLLQILFGDYPSLAGIGYLIGAIPVSYYGIKWNRKVEEESKVVGENLPKHSLFWIHLQYWGIISSIVGITILISEYITDLGTDLTLIIWLIGSLGVIFYQLYREKHKDI